MHNKYLAASSKDHPPNAWTRRYSQWRQHFLFDIDTKKAWGIYEECIDLMSNKLYFKLKGSYVLASNGIGDKLSTVDACNMLMRCGQTIERLHTEDLFKPSSTKIPSYDGKVTVKPVQGDKTTSAAGTIRKIHTWGLQEDIVYLADPDFLKFKTSSDKNGSDALIEVLNPDNLTYDLINQSDQIMTTFEQSNDVSQTKTEITSDSNIISYSQYLSETQQETVQNSNSSAQQMVLNKKYRNALTEEIALEKKLSNLITSSFIKRPTALVKREQGLVIAALKNELRKLKGKALDKEATETHSVDSKIEHVKANYPQDLLLESAFRNSKKMDNSEDVCITVMFGMSSDNVGPNLSSGQFCDSNLEVAFCQHTCFIRNIEGVDLLTGSRGDNLYASHWEYDGILAICLLSKAVLNKSGLWHRSLSTLNFGAIKSFLQGHGLIRVSLSSTFEKGSLIGYSHSGEVSKLDEDKEGKAVDPYTTIVDSSFALTAFADVDHAGCQDTRRSTSGKYYNFVGIRLVSGYLKGRKAL
ncbi:hypothetical protein Tco_1359974 [Tanacetum coccineum]